MLYLFENHVLDTDRRELRRGTMPVVIEPQVFDLLAYLIQQRERVVSKDDLIATIWKGRRISESALSTCINAARNAVDDEVSSSVSSVPFLARAFASSVMRVKKKIPAGAPLMSWRGCNQTRHPLFPTNRQSLSFRSPI